MQRHTTTKKPRWSKQFWNSSVKACRTFLHPISPIITVLKAPKTSSEHHQTNLPTDHAVPAAAPPVMPAGYPYYPGIRMMLDALIYWCQRGYESKLYLKKGAEVERFPVIHGSSQCQWSWVYEKPAIVQMKWRPTPWAVDLQESTPRHPSKWLKECHKIPQNHTASILA